MSRNRREPAAGRDGRDAQAPRRCPRKALAARNSSRLIPDVVANAPISRNSGTTAKLKSVTVRIVVWPTILNAGAAEVR